MKLKNPFFKKNNNIYLNDILKILGKNKENKKIKINDISDLSSASVNDISFISSLKQKQNLLLRMSLTQEKLNIFVNQSL